MIIGIGIDIIAPARLERFWERRGDHGLRRLFTPHELRYCLALASPAPSLAARFAAKEAFFKALGLGFGAGGRWLDVEVLRDGAGRPELHLRDRAAQRARAQGVRRMHLSLSHTDTLATAFVLLEA